MKVTVENKKGLNKDLKVFIDKETMNSYMDEKYEEIKGSVNLKGFRPGKVPKEILKRQFGKAVFGEVLDKVLKETSTKALEENKIKKAKFNCKILSVKQSEEVKIDDDFAKNLGAKDLKDLKTLISKQINDEYKNSLDQLSKNQILKEIEKIKVDEVPENLIEEEVKVLSQGMSEEEAKKNKKNFEDKAKTRIKTGLILNEFGEKNQIKVTEQEVQAEVQKQLRMMPGQEKMVMDFYQKNPSALASLRGTVYEEKILNLIKEKGKANKKEISKEEAEKILKEAHKHDHDHDHNHGEEKKETKKKSSTTSAKEKKPATKKAKSKPAAKKAKKVSKK